MVCRVGLDAPRVHSGTKVEKVQIVTYVFIDKYRVVNNL